MNRIKDHVSRIVPEIISNVVLEQYRKVNCGSFFISVEPPNDCVFVGDDFYLVKNLLLVENEKIKVVATKLKKTGDLDDYPLKSSLINIFKVETEEENNYITFDLRDIKYKCIKFQLSEKEWAVFPLNHFT